LVAAKNARNKEVVCLGGVLKSVSELNLRQDKLEEKVVKVEEGLNQIRGERLDQQKKMEVEMKKVRDELQDLKLKEENATWLFMGCQKPMQNRMWDVWWK
jgi:SMC interacting uncharacterized protein involved in chromosome segregation